MPLSIAEEALLNIIVPKATTAISESVDSPCGTLHEVTGAVWAIHRSRTKKESIISKGAAGVWITASCTRLFVPAARLTLKSPPPKRHACAAARTKGVPMFFEISRRRSLRNEKLRNLRDTQRYDAVLFLRLAGVTEKLYMTVAKALYASMSGRVLVGRMYLYRLNTRNEHPVE